MTARVRPVAAWPAAVLAGLASLLVYATTVTPTITWRNDGADSGELAAAVMTLGVPHPPGYPTYVLAGRLATLLIPFGDPAHRLALLSALSAAVAVAIAVLAAAAISHPRTRTDQMGLALAGLALGLAPLYWSQATIPEVYAPAAAPLAAGLLLLARRLQQSTRGDSRLVPAAGLLLGLGAGLHADVLFLVIASIPALVLTRVPRREIMTAAGFLALGLAIFLIVPLLAMQRPPIAWGDPVDLEGFLWAVTMAPYRSLAFSIPLADLPGRVLGLAGFLVRQFGPVGWFLAAWGIAGIWTSGNRWAISLLVGLSCIAIVYALGYDSRDYVVYVIPTLIAAAIAMAIGASVVLRTLADWNPRYAAIGAVFLVAAAPGLSLVLHYQELDLSEDREALAYAIDVAGAASPDGLIVAESDERVFSLWYYRYVHALDRAPDVVAAGLLQFEWYRDQVRRATPGVLPPEPLDYSQALNAVVTTRDRPVYVTDPGLASGYPVEPMMEDERLYRIAIP